MFWRRKKPPEPPRDLRGVPLEILHAMLQPTSIKSRIEGATLIADHGKYTTRVEVVGPDANACGPDPIRAVVRVSTTLPAELSSFGNLATPSGTAMLNAFASLGAVTARSGELVVGSRLTIFEGEEEAWTPLHLPLLLFTVIGAGESVIGGFRRTLSGQSARTGTSAWTDADLAQTHRQLSQFSVCNLGRGDLTAEFGLTDGAVSAALGHRATALFQVNSRQAHPEFGPGLFCLLQLPHAIRDEAKLLHTCSALNNSELAACDQPPHFGAWCPNRMDNGVAYVCFLPNALHQVEGIATNVAVWAMHRAKWADDVLTSAGIKR